MSKSSSTNSRRTNVKLRPYALSCALLLGVGFVIFHVARVAAKGGRARTTTTQHPAKQEGGQKRRPAAKTLPPDRRTLGGQEKGRVQFSVRTADKFDVSPPLRSIKPIVTMEEEEKGDDDRGAPGPVNDTRHDPDPVVQYSTGSGVFSRSDEKDIAAAGVSFDGLPNPAPPPFNTGPVPPDPDGDIGPNHYVQMVNVRFQIFTRAGVSVFGPANVNTLFTGFGGACETENAGDPVVLYDQLADRWLLSQFTGAGPTYFNCVAISTTGDPTGSYYRYAISTGAAGANFPDYPKYGIWPDAYYLSTREFFENTTFSGVGAYALEREQMLRGNPAARIVSFIVPPGTTAYRIGDGLLPADLDGFTLPPAGSPNYFVGTMDNGGPYGAPSDALNLFEFHVDWTTPVLSTFAFTAELPTAAFDSIFPCSGGSTPSRNCIPQPGTTTKIDILSYRQRPTFRLAYRNFGTHESLVTTQSVEAVTAQAGMRWWEIRSPHVGPSIFQEGTYAPDTVQRWMGSVSMDKDGNMALGYSVSDATSVFPGLRYTGRLATDPLGQMPQGEGIIVSGAGSQTSTSSRWGDYSSMTMDPNNDCNFWYTNEYYTATTARGWKTRIGAFRFPQCNVPAGPVIAAGQLVFNEFRLRGPSGALDEFIELYNTLDTDLAVKTADGTGLAVVSSDAPTLAKCVVPEGTIIKARSHFLCADTASPSPGAAPAFSLSTYPASNDSTQATTAVPNANILSDIPDTAGLALFATTTAADFTLANRLDAVGPNTLPGGSLFNEGTGLSPAPTTDIQYALYRDLKNGTPRDTGDNSADFVLVDPAGTTGRLGAPGPENTSAPVQRNTTIKASLIDPQQPSTGGQNRVRDPTPGTGATAQGTLAIRRKFTNMTGAPVTRLRFRIVDITTAPAPTGTADLRALGGQSGSFTVMITGGGSATVQRLTLEQPPNQANGGGFNASLSADSVATVTPIAPGASINVEFLLGVAQAGSFRIFVNVEALP